MILIFSFNVSLYYLLFDIKFTGMLTFYQSQIYFYAAYVVYGNINVLLITELYHSWSKTVLLKNSLETVRNIAVLSNEKLVKYINKVFTSAICYKSQLMGKINEATISIRKCRLIKCRKTYFYICTSLKWFYLLFFILIYIY